MPTRVKNSSLGAVCITFLTQQEHDYNTGLIYFGARYYDPDTARFLTQDTYLGVSNAPPSLHRYLYAYSNPTVYIDLFGYESILPHIKDEKPLDAAMWKKGQFTDEATRFSDELTDDEKAYLLYFKLDRVNPGSLSKEQRAQANQLFGDKEDAYLQYANWSDRARIIRHYSFTHPATINLLMGTYRLSRDVNPIAFSFERGWQVASGKEFATGQTVSRVRSGVEFLTAIALIKGTQVGLNKLNAKLTGENNGAGLVEAKPIQSKNNVLQNQKIINELQSDPNAVYGYSPKPGTRYSKFDFTDPVEVAKNRTIRIQYLKETEALETLIQKMKQSGCPTQDIAKRVVLERNLQKIQARESMTPEAVSELEAGNIKRYNNPVGPTAEQLYKKYGSWEKVIEKSLEKDPVINKLLGIE